MGKIQYLMDTQGHCFLCLSSTTAAPGTAGEEEEATADAAATSSSPPPGEQNGSGNLPQPKIMSFTSFCDHLGINLKEICKEAQPISSTGLSILDCSELKGLLCQDCVPIFERFLKDFYELEMMRMRIQFSLKQIYDKMVEVDKKRNEAKDWDEFDKELLKRQQTSLKNTFVEQLRRKAMERCSTVIERQRPYVVLNKLKPPQRRSRPIQVITIPDEEGREEEMEVMLPPDYVTEVVVIDDPSTENNTFSLQLGQMGSTTETYEIEMQTRGAATTTNDSSSCLQMTDDDAGRGTERVQDNGTEMERVVPQNGGIETGDAAAIPAETNKKPQSVGVGVTSSSGRRSLSAEVTGNSKCYVCQKLLSEEDKNKGHQHGRMLLCATCHVKHIQVHGRLRRKQGTASKSPKAGKGKMIATRTTTTTATSQEEHVQRNGIVAGEADAAPAQVTQADDDMATSTVGSSTPPPAPTQKGAEATEEVEAASAGNHGAGDRRPSTRRAEQHACFFCARKFSLLISKKIHEERCSNRRPERKAADKSIKRKQKVGQAVMNGGLEKELPDKKDAPPTTPIRKQAVEDSLKCRLCPKRFHSRDKLERHMRYFHHTARFQCLLCDKKFSRDMIRSRHMKYSCPNRDNKAEAKAEELAPATVVLNGHHHQTPETNLNLPDQDMEVENGERGQQHDKPLDDATDQELAEEDSANDDMDMECDVCQTKVRDHLSHKCTYHEIRLTLNDLGEVKGEEVIPKLPCLTIIQPASESGSALSQATTLNCKTIFRCGFCNGDFSSRSDYSQHHKATHMGRRYKCDLCDDMFRQKIGFVRHRLMEHPGSKFKCSFCPKTFTQFNNLNRHVKSRCAGRKPPAAEWTPRKTRSGK